MLAKGGSSRLLVHTIRFESSNCCSLQANFHGILFALDEPFSWVERRMTLRLASFAIEKSLPSLAKHHPAVETLSCIHLLHQCLIDENMTKIYVASSLLKMTIGGELVFGEQSW
jgi:hypothetical protein